MTFLIDIMNINHYFRCTRCIDIYARLKRSCAEHCSLHLLLYYVIFLSRWYMTMWLECDAWSHIFHVVINFFISDRFKYLDLDRADFSIHTTHISNRSLFQYFQPITTNIFLSTVPQRKVKVDLEQNFRIDEVRNVNVLDF